MSGRKPLPTKLKMLKGTAQKCRVNPNEPKLAPALPEPPDFLGETAREEWLRKAPVLARMTDPAEPEAHTDKEGNADATPQL